MTNKVALNDLFLRLEHLAGIDRKERDYRNRDVFSVSLTTVWFEDSVWMYRATTITGDKRTFHGLGNSPTQALEKLCFELESLVRNQVEQWSLMLTQQHRFLCEPCNGTGHNPKEKDEGCSYCAGTGTQGETP